MIREGLVADHRSATTERTGNGLVEGAASHRAILAVAVRPVCPGNLTLDDGPHGDAESVDLGDLVVEAEADANHARGAALVAVAYAGQPLRRSDVVEPEQVGDVGMGTEAAAAHSDAVLVAEDRRDKAVVEAVDGEREYPDRRSGRRRSVDLHTGDLDQYGTSLATSVTMYPAIDAARIARRLAERDRRIPYAAFDSAFILVPVASRRCQLAMRLVRSAAIQTMYVAVTNPTTS